MSGGTGERTAEFVVGGEYVDVRDQTRRIRVVSRSRDFVLVDEPAKHERRQVKLRTYRTETRFAGCYDVVEYLSVDDGLYNPTGRYADTPF